MTIKPHFKVTDEVMDELYRHVPTVVLAKLYVDRRGITRLMRSENDA